MASGDEPQQAEGDVADDRRGMLLNAVGRNADTWRGTLATRAASLGRDVHKRHSAATTSATHSRRGRRAGSTGVQRNDGVTDAVARLAAHEAARQGPAWALGHPRVTTGIPRGFPRESERVLCHDTHRGINVAPLTHRGVG